MFWADNRAWGARTRFSDDLFVLEEAPPQICDDLKQRRFAMLDVRPGKGRSDPNHYRDQPMIHHPSRSSVVSKAKGPAQRDRRCMAASICSCGKCHRECGPSPSMRSEEHTSELQSLMRISYAVFCLKKKKTYISTN